MIAGARALALAALLAVSLVGCSAPASRSALLIVIDTLRADHLGLYGADRDTSPRIDAWAERGAVYLRAYVTSPWTLPTMGSILTGRLPSSHRAGTPAEEAADRKSRFYPLSPGVSTLAELLAQEGFTTGAVMNNPFLHPRFGVARGFQTYDYVPGNRLKIRDAELVVDRALEWLDRHGDERFLLVVHFFDPHLNYQAPEGYRGRFAGELPVEGDRRMELKVVRQRLRQGLPVDLEFLRAAYDEEIAFVDAQVGRLLDGLGERRLDRSTLVALTSDHGEEFGEHGGFEHGHTAFEELLRVPLVLAGPGVEPGRRVEPASVVDIFPTVLGALGVAADSDLPGTSLLGATEELADRLLVAERNLYGAEVDAAVRWPLKLIRRRGVTRLHDLEADPEERRDLARARPRVARRMAEELDAVLAAAASGAADEPVELDDETLEHLRSLGYIQ